MSVESTDQNTWAPEDWKYRIFNWQLLRGFGQSAPATLSMATPFIGYLILYHSKVENFLGGLGGLLDGQTSGASCTPFLEFSTRLNFIYIGLLFLGIGTILFRLFAPSVVKNSRDLQEYVTSSVDNVSARNLRSMFATIRSRRRQVSAGLLERAPWLDRTKSLKTASDALIKHTDNQLKIDVLSSYYSALDRNTMRPCMYVVLLFFSFGMLLLAVPGIAFTTRVLCAVIYG